MTRLRAGTYGDTGADFVLRMKSEDGTAIDVTTATSITLDWEATDGTKGSVSGAVVAPGTSGYLRFEDTYNVANPGTRRSLTLEGEINFTIGGEVFISDRVTWVIRRPI